MEPEDDEADRQHILAFNASLVHLQTCCKAHEKVSKKQDTPPMSMVFKKKVAEQRETPPMVTKEPGAIAEKKTIEKEERLKQDTSPPPKRTKTSDSHTSSVVLATSGEDLKSSSSETPSSKTRNVLPKQLHSSSLVSSSSSPTHASSSSPIQTSSSPRHQVALLNRIHQLPKFNTESSLFTPSSSIDHISNYISNPRLSSPPPTSPRILNSPPNVEFQFYTTTSNVVLKVLAFAKEYTSLFQYAFVHENALFAELMLDNVLRLSQELSREFKNKYRNQMIAHPLGNEQMKQFEEFLELLQLPGFAFPGAKQMACSKATTPPLPLQQCVLEIRYDSSHSHSYYTLGLT